MLERGDGGPHVRGLIEEDPHPHAGRDADKPEKVDLAIVALPAPLVEPELDRLHEKDIRRAIIISSGFAEVGEAGISMQTRIAEKAKRYGIRIIGPNALGVYNTDNGLDSFFVSRERVSRPEPGGLSVISQSGAITVIIMEALTRDGMGIAKAVNYGNRLDIDDADCLDYFADDPRTGAVAMYMESVADGVKFLRSAKAFAAKKPLVIWKAGKFELGAAAVASHTATLAGTPAASLPRRRVCTCSSSQAAIACARLEPPAHRPGPIEH